LRNSPPPLAQLMRAPQRRTASCGGAPASGLDRAARLLLRRRRGGSPGAAAAGARARPRGALPARFRTRAVRRSFAISHLRMTCTRAPRC